jgi:hypothetical protein
MDEHEVDELLAQLIEVAAGGLVGVLVLLDLGDEVDLIAGTSVRRSASPTPGCVP